MNLVGALFAMSLGSLVQVANVPPPNVPPPNADPALDFLFKCPEQSPNMGAYIRELQRWLHAAKVRHPDWSSEQIGKLRHELRLKHHCTGRMRAPPAGGFHT